MDTVDYIICSLILTVALVFSVCYINDNRFQIKMAELGYHQTTVVGSERVIWVK